MKIGRDFLENFDASVLDLLKFILEEGFIVTLVGGAVRDFILKGEIPSDLDFELRHSRPFKGKEWEDKIKSLIQKIKKHKRLPVELLPFSIFRIKCGNTTLEFSSPRVEVFSVGGDSHKNFKVTLSSDLTYEEAFSRRDFSFNAMAIEFLTFNEFKFIDPFKGLNDLKLKKLRPCGENFTKDPVRFLRAIRFKNKLKFSFHKELLDSMPNFNLTSLSLFYFFSEGFKVELGKFLKDFFSYTEKFQIPYHESFNNFKSISGFKLEGIKNQNELGAFLIQMKPELLNQLGDFLPLKKKLMSDIIKTSVLFKKIKKFKFEKMILSVNVKGPEELLNDSNLIVLSEFLKLRSRLPNEYKGFYLSKEVDSFQIDTKAATIYCEKNKLPLKNIYMVGLILGMKKNG